MAVSKRAQAIRPFVVMDVVAKAKAMQASGIDVVRLEIGDPDLPTPEVVTRAGKEAMEHGDTGYTQSAGLPNLREAVSAHYRDVYGVDVDPEYIIVTQGTSPAMLLLFGALLDPGDEVDRKSTRLNSSHMSISYAVFCLTCDWSSEIGRAHV